MAIHGKRVTIRPVDMQMVLDIVEKAPQLGGLKNPIPPKKQNNQHPSTGGKYPPGAHKVSAANKKKKDAFLAETGLTGDEIEEITH